MFSSPFISKLGTNFCPTDDELKDISAYLAEPIEKLASLDTKIGYLQEALANVRIERDILHEHVEAHNALVSPLRRMPLDILQEIFVACLPTERNCVMSADEAPILLGRICSAWREIAYNTPRLWAKLHIFEPMVPSYYSDAHILSAASQCAVKLQQRAEVTKEWLTRSGDCPLSISFSCPNQFVDAARSIISTILPFKARWEHIYVAAPTSVLAHIADVSADEVPFLKSFYIVEMFSNNRLEVEKRPWGLFSAANLTSLQMFAHCFHQLQLPVHWDRLVRLDMSVTPKNHTDAPTSQRALQLAARCPNLRSYKVLVQNFDQVMPPEPVLELAHLHTLHIDCVGGFKMCVTELLGGRLLLPKLRNLKCRGRTRPEDRLDLSLAPFCAAARNIECVELSFDVFSKDSLAEFIRLVSRTLRKLKMYPGHNLGGEGSENVFDDDIMGLLTPVDGNPGHCPILEQLDVSYCAFSERVLMEFVRPRMRAGTLKRVAVRFRDSAPTTVDIAADLKAFVAAGLEVDVAYPKIPEVIVSPWKGLNDGMYD